MGIYFRVGLHFGTPKCLPMGSWWGTNFLVRGCGLFLQCCSFLVFLMLFVTLCLCICVLVLVIFQALSNIILLCGQIGCAFIVCGVRVCVV